MIRYYITFSFIQLVLCYNSCLHLRSLCLRSEQCNSYLQSFYHACGYSLTGCTGNSMSDCVYYIRKIREFFPHKNCICYEELGSSDECDYFRQLIWNSPCVRKIEDAAETRKLMSNVYHHSFISNRRTTRTPVSHQVQQWKSQLSGELGTRDILQKTTCNEALDSICLRHVSCSQLWKIFRNSCVVDQDNQCRMTDRETCWQSFEGLTWTGLGNCHCQTNNSDCHWIRLHTNYNKCIYEISKSVDPPPRSSLFTNGNDQTDTLTQYQQRYETTYGRNRSIITTTTSRPDDQWITVLPGRTAKTTPSSLSTRNDDWVTVLPGRNSKIESRPRASTDYSHLYQQQYHPVFHSSTPPPRPPLTSQAPQFFRSSSFSTSSTTSTTTTSSTTTTIDPSTIITSSINPPIVINAKVSSKSPAPIEASKPAYEQGQLRTNSRLIHQSESYNFDSRPTPKTTSFTTLISQFPTHFIAKEFSARSSCQDAIKRCESAEECRWHLGELKVRCESSTCRRDECAAALQRFSRYVPFSLVESIMFCHCSSSDTSCTTHQDLLYPKCLYSSVSSALTCTETARKCDSDSRCRHMRHSLSVHCPIVDEQCKQISLDNCRRTLLTARASILEQPCFCPLSDIECLSHQRLMIPNNPCIEKAMMEYSRLMGYSGIKSTSIQTNRITSIDDISTIGKMKITPPPESSYDRIINRPQERKKEEKIKEEKDREEIERRIDNTPTPQTMENKIIASNGRKQKIKTTQTPSEVLITTPQLIVLEKKDEGKPRQKYRTTMEAPTTTETPPPWVTTTPFIPTPSTTFITHPPPPPEGCNTKDASGKSLFINRGTIIRRYDEWSSKCSSWCECIGEEELICSRLPCLPSGNCNIPSTDVDFGERIYLKERGACFCESGKFICDLPEESPQVYPGLYLSAGYSTSDVELLRKNMTRESLEKAGFLSSDAATDIASRLQIAFERLLPEKLECRIVLMPELGEEGYAFFRTEWYGRNEYLNHTKIEWHSGWAEKVCAPYVSRLADHFALNEAPRFQLVLSTVKQLKMLDYLNGLPTSSSINFISLYTFMLILCTNYYLSR